MKTRKMTVAATLALLAGASSALASPLVIQSNNSQQQIDFIVGPEAGRVEMYGLNGNAGPIVFEGVTSLTVLTGTSFDAVDVYFVTDATFPVSVSTGNGGSDVKVRYLIQPSAAISEAEVTITGGSGNDTANIEAESFTAGFVADWSVNLGAGTNESSAKINLPQPSDLVSLTYAYTGGTGEDKSAVDVISYSAETLVSVANTMGSGNDLVSVIADSFAGGSLSAAVTGNLGSGNDTAELNFNNLQGVSAISGDINGAVGDDTLKLSGEFSGSFTTIFRGAGGNDITDMFVKGDITGTPRQLTGGGNDFLKMFIDGTYTNNPVLNGGAGFDVGVGVGTFIGVEQIN